MKKNLYFLLATLIFTLSACSDEESGNPKINEETEVSKITISESMTSDGGTVSKKDTYSFTAGKLINHITLQEYYEQSLSHESNFSYSANQAILTDNSGNVATYTLKENGYAQKCIYQMGDQTREYDFSYSNNYLTQINETIDEEVFSSVTLKYNSSGDLQNIQVNEANILCQVGKDMNQYNLPCLILSDIHPLSLHIDAIFAKLLGKQSAHLVTRTAPEGNEKEWTDYTYQLDTDHKPTQIMASTTSTGLVYDRDGKASEVTRTDTRALTLAIK